MKITIVLEFDNIDPTTQDIIDYVNECGENLDYTKEDQSVEYNKGWNDALGKAQEIVGAHKND
jgi:hypothetical protein|tara:strand:+ start:414 stop:602 length:189 start_codon:yes stop_codon:yes gene_type:complete